MSKDKKKKKKSGKHADSSAVGGLKALAQNPIVADVVAAALVATASALKDSNRARALASDTGDELEKMSKANLDRGNALWAMALEIGKRSLDALAGETARGKSSSGKSGSSKGKKKAAAKSDD